MAELGKVEGQKLVGLFNLLIEKRIIISMQVAGTDFERLTCVTAITEGPNGKRLCIDAPKGFGAAAGNPDAVTLRFHFNGPDRVEHFFTTHGVSHQGRDLDTPFPAFVERVQRRKDFRMQAPPGARMLIKQDKLHAILDLVNISMGGALGVMRKHNLKQFTGPVFSEAQTIAHTGIIFPPTKAHPELIIIIKTAEVRRIEHDRPRKRYRYAFHFKALDDREKEKLTQAIYHLQREFLQRR